MTHLIRPDFFGRFFALAVLSLLLAAVVSGQNAAARPDRGTMPNGSYSVSDIENISLQNGNVNLSIPLASLPPIAGGKLSWTIKAHYNSKLWDITREEHDASDDQWQPYVKDVPQVSERGGWRISGQYAIEIRPVSWDFDFAMPPPDAIPYNEYQLLVNHNWYKVVLIMPDGAEHELRPVDYTAMADGTGLTFLYGYYNVSPYTQSQMRYYSFDGSYLSATVNSNASSWTIYLPDGTKVVQTTDGIQRIQDTNGNKIKIYSDTNGTHYQDEQTGREIRYGADQKVWYQTVGGDWQSIEIVWDTTIVQGKVYRVNDWMPYQINPRPCVKHATLFAEMQVIREIVLPQTEPGQPQRRFEFTYNSDTTESATNSVKWSCPELSHSYTREASKGWGELSRIETPSDAIIDYSYKLDSGNLYAHLPMFTDDIPAQSITQKKLTHDGAVDTWTYAIDSMSGSVTGPDGSIVGEAKYEHAPGTGSNYGKSGLVYRSTRPFTTIERHWTNLVFSGASINSPGGHVDFNGVVDAEYTTLTDANGNALKMSAKTFQHDYNGNVLQSTEYDWFDPTLVSRDASGVPTGVPGGATVLRVVNNSYYNPATSSTSGNVYAKRSTSGTPLILNAPQQTTVGPALSQFSYDGQAYGTAPTVGNLTSQSVWDDLDSKWITSSQTYGLYGNLATKTDARGKVTQFYYDDSTHALLNRVVVDPQNGTGTQTSTTAFDYYTGLVTSQTDPNNQTSTINYINQLLFTVDPFNRPGVTIGPLVNAGGANQQHRVTTTYKDSARQVIVAADLNTENDKLLKTRTTVDMLGRPILSEQTEDGTNYTISSRKIYSQMGKITFSSNPAASVTASTDGWTRGTTDTAGRVTEVATFGGATQPPATGTNGTWTGSVTTVYDATFTTVTDEAGKLRRSVVDALGRLVRIDEPDGSNNLGSTASPLQPTSYTYSSLGNLLTVVQGAQTRTFTYDSLSRLRTALNPEVCDQQGVAIPITYAYDDNGNLTQKTDARGVVSTYVYDALNRNKTIDYSDTTTINPDVTRFYDGAVKGKGRFWYSYAGGDYSNGSNVEHTAVDSYDAAGKPLIQRQLFKLNGAWSGQTYQTQRSYKLSGALESQIYPSGHTVSYAYDQAGRTNSFSGNLGDGSQRTYTHGIAYASGGQMAQEQFGTATPVFNKLFYNSRQQLAEILAGTGTSGDIAWNRGKILNQYSLQCSGAGCNATDNNGNLRKQEVYIPNNEQNTSATSWYQQYDYDSLNRLQRAHEYTGDTQKDWQQEYVYDRWGNRTIHQGQTNTWGAGINKKEFTVNPANNRLGVPGGQNGAMTYDNAGNLTTDTYSGSGVTRAYDAENRMTSEMQAGSYVAGAYTYNADGQRVRRKGDVETWQVYGFDGELLGEYAASAAPASPQKEYGYRNGQLLITAEAPVPAVNVALASNGATVTASSAYSGWAASGAINGDRKGLNGGQNGAWVSATTGFPAWLQVDFNGSKTIGEIDVFTLQDNWQSPSEPTEAMTFNTYGLTGYEVQYWNGSAWVTVTGGSITGNNKVWRKFTFAAVTTSKIRVLTNASTDGYSRLTEVEAWTGTAPPPPPARTNFGLSANGAVVTASSAYSGWAASGAINGDRKGLNGGQNGAWVSAQTGFPAWLQVDFNGSKTIDEVDVFTLQDTWQNPSEPTEAMTFNTYGLTGYEVQYWNGSAWVTVTGGSITGNNKVWRKFTFTAITTTKIRVLTNASTDGFSRLTEVEALSPAGGSGAVNLALNKPATQISDHHAVTTANRAVDGNTNGNQWENGYTAGTNSHLNSWWQVDLQSVQAIGSIEVWGRTDCCPEMTSNFYVLVSDNPFTSYDLNATLNQSGVSNYYVSGYSGTPGTINVNRTGRYVRVQLAGTDYLVLGEVKVLSQASSGGGSAPSVTWMVSDQLGTPRMVFDQTGSLATMKRHDYLPFGEELTANQGLRTGTQGFGADNTRQKFTQQERDNETGLDYFLARYYSSAQGRFTSVDPFNIALDTQMAAELNPERARALFNAYLSQPQQWNRYAYAINNPLLYVDPTGEAIQLSNDKDERARQMQALRDALKEAGAYIYENLGEDGNYYVGIYDNGPNGNGPAFEQVNEVAGEFGPVIRDQQVATLELVRPGTVTDDSGVSRDIGAAGRASLKPGGPSPGVTGIFNGRLTIKMLDWGRKTWWGGNLDLGYLPGVLMKDGKDNMLTPSVLVGHEIAHARAQMTGEKDSRAAAVRLENKIRKLQFPNGPQRKRH